MAQRWVCLDVGETLIDETRVFTTWAEVLGVPPFTLLAAFGAVIARGGDHRDAFALVGHQDWEEHRPEVTRRYGGFQMIDLYPDALPAISGLRGAGFRLAVIANQPGSRTAELKALGVEAEVVAMSEEMKVSKPSVEFFSRALELMGGPDAADVAYVGDRLDNDVIPATAAGMRPVWIRRGPWAAITSERPPDGTLIVDSLAELVDRIDSWWTQG